jgi:hypothetical protein
MTAVQRDAVAYFVRMGWTPEQSAGLVANLVAESGLRPDAVGDGGQAYGIAQWHPDRQSNFAGLIGKPMEGSTLEEQLAFVHAELRGTEKHAGDALAICTTASEAGAVVSKLYERPADREGEAARRSSLAESLLAEYGGASGGGVTSTVPPSTATPDAPATPQQPEKPMGAAMMFLPYILQMVPGLNKIPGLATAAQTIPTTGAAGGSPHAADYLPLVQAIVDAFKGAVPGAVNEQDAIAKAQANPAIAAAAAQAVLQTQDVIDQLNKLTPVLDRIHQYEKDSWASEDTSRDAAAARAIAQQKEGPLWNNPTFIIAILVMILVTVVVAAVLFKGGFSTDMQAFVIGAIVGSALTAVLSFYFGSSRNSAAKDATISQLANK